jgi:type IV pilus assembly protein PilY1
MRTDANAPVQNSCEKNFALQFTDGYSQTSTSSGVGNADSSAGSPYSDTYSNTLADIAYKYYSTPLRTGAGFSLGQIDLPAACSDPTPPPDLDCNANLHMNTYGIVLGGVGKNIFGVNDGGVVRTTVADAYTNPPTWPDVNSIRNATQIDDLYHATVNGRGEMFRASSPQELTSSLEQALDSIKRLAGSASRVSFNSSALSAGSLIYAAGFNAEKWSGDVKAYALDINSGDLSATSAWSVSQDWLDKTSGGLLHSARTILTHNGTKGVGFKWSNWSKLNAAQQADLNAASAGTAHEVIDYIRGDRSKEGSGGFRIRDSALGDFVYSNLVYVGKPPLKWPDSPLFIASSGPVQYSDYRLALVNNPRKEMIYIGGNDGMLHGFVASQGDTDSGKELLAFIPGSVFSSNTNAGLHYLTDRNYTHRFYVDLSPTVSDVILNNKWSTILVGGERSGGRSLFALNVTDPSLFGDDDTKALNTVLWEFSETDLGYTYSKPTIVKLNNGKWGAVFGNGYNNTGSGEAKLFIVELEPGGGWSENSNYYKLNTGVGSAGTPNGLATPAVVDLDGNGTADRVYAGDLRGNMWAFDISDSVTTNWGSKYENPTNVPVPLFKAQHGVSPTIDQPITVQPTAVLHPTIPTDPGNNEPNVMLFFGTGQYLETPDINNPSGTQSFYGIWDRGTAELTRSALQVQTLIDESSTDANGDALRLLSDNAVDYVPAVPSDQQYGWYFDLPALGERSVLPAYVRGDLVFYNTWVPSSPPCTVGGRGYLMSVSQETGGEPSESAFDVTADGVVDGSDTVSFSGGNHAPAGKSFNHGLPTGSGFLDEYRYTSGTQGGCSNGICKDKLRPLSSIKTGRLSWQELGRD